MSNQLTISFVLKRTRPDETGKVPVYVRITINSIRTEFSLKRKTDPKRWFKRAGKANGNTEEAKTLNAHLYNVDVKLRQIYQSHSDLNETITPLQWKNEYLGKTARGKLLMEVFRYHNVLIISSTDLICELTQCYTLLPLRPKVVQDSTYPQHSFSGQVRMVFQCTQE